MNDKEQTQHFADDLDRLVERYRHEYDVTYAAVVGVLQMKSFNMCQEAQRQHLAGPEGSKPE